MVKLPSKVDEPLYTPLAMAKRFSLSALPATLAIMNFVISSFSAWI